MRTEVSRLTRLKRVLHELLQQDDISLESGIVNDLIFRMAEVEVPNEERSNFGFQFRDHWNTTDALEFNIPRLPMKELKKLLTFFKIPEEQYVANAPLSLDKDFVFDQLVLNFTKYYKELKEAKSPLITQYQVRSLPILESTAINTLNEYTKKALETLESDKTKATKSSTLTDALLLLQSKVDHLRQYPTFYIDVINLGVQFALLRHKNTNSELNKPLELILEGIDFFKRYNRFESVLAIKSFMKEIEQFLNNDYQISAESCDVIEETLLQIVGAELGKQGKCSVEKGSDASRMVFHFTDMSKESAEKAIRYFQSMGDKTATEGYGYGHYGSSIPESSIAKSMSTSEPSYSTRPRDNLEYHSIEVDGKFFYDKMFPELKKHLALTDADTIQKYRDESKDCLEARAKEKEVKMAVSSEATSSASASATDKDRHRHFRRVRVTKERPALDVVLESFSQHK